MSKDLDESVDKLEAATDPNTVISIGGYNFTPAKLMIAGTIVSTVLGGLYGAFEVYKDYMSMKEAIQTYVAPDLSAIQERITKMEERVDNAVVMVDESGDIIRDVRSDLKGDIDAAISRGVDPLTVPPVKVPPPVVPVTTLPLTSKPKLITDVPEPMVLMLNLSTYAVLD